MDDDTTEPFGFPAIGRTKVVAAFDGGRLTSDGGVMLRAETERQLDLCVSAATRPVFRRGWRMCWVGLEQGASGRHYGRHW